MKKRALVAVLCALILAGGALAKETIKHPLAVLKATFNPDNGTSMGSMKGEATVWLKNLSDVAVDGVKVEMVLYNGGNGRKVDTITKNVGEMPAGDKRFLQFKWEVYGPSSLKPRIWVYYNGGGEEPVKFEGEPPIWGS